MLVQSILIICLFYTISCETCVGNNGNKGKCVRISECPSVIVSRNKIDEPKLCDFSSVEPIICCEENLKNTTEPFPPGCKEIWKNNRRFSSRIGGGGIDALAYEFPHMAALGYDGENNETIWGCGGTLITPEYVLTAAHCLHSKIAGEVNHVRLGDLNLNSDDDDAEPQDFKVNQKIRHPGYHPPSPYNDLAIIKLDKPCNITSYVIPACLNTKKELPNETYSATGWGQLGYGGPIAHHLQNMRINIYNHADCLRAYSRIRKRRLFKGIDEETQVCAGAPRIDTCPGDSGGPLQLWGDDNTVYGVTSFGVACVISRIPGVYIKVSPYISWIKSIILP